MSVLQIVGTVVGAVIGTLITPGVGTLVGAGIGGAIGAGINSIVNPPRIEGARLGDLSVVSSATGTVRPVGYGKIRVAGNVIWAIPITEHKREQKDKGKGGPISIIYTYGATFALALCEGPVSNVLRIWADSKLQYDTTPGSDVAQKAGFNFRFYPGNETQTADSIIVSHEGAGNVPGYRGTCYLVFDDIPLDDYGNRIPNITVELAYNTAVAFDYELLHVTTASIFTTIRSTIVAVNPLSHIGYVYGASPPGLVEFDLDTMEIIREKPFTEITAGLGSGDNGGTDPEAYSNGVVGWDGAFYFTTGDTTPGVGPNIVRVDPNTLLATAEFPAYRSASWTSLQFGFANRLCFIALLDPDDGLVSQLLVSSIDNDIGSLTTPGLAYVWGATAPRLGLSCTAMAQGKIGLGRGEAWSFTTVSTVLFYINKISMDGGLVPDIATVAEFAPAAFDVSATVFSFAGGNPGTVIYDEGDDGLLFQVDLSDGATTFSVLAKWSQTSGLLYSIRTPPGFTGTSHTASFGSRISSGTYGRLDTNGIVWYFNSATGALISNDTWPGLTGAPNSNQVYDSGRKIILAYILLSGGAGGWAKLRVGRLTATNTTLGAIVLDQCERAGFDAADVDVSALTDVVDGFVISQRSLVIDVLKPLMQIYLVDAVESDYVLKFVHRGGAPAANLTEADLVRTGETEPFVETRQQEIELPMRVTLTYIDSDKNFQQNTQIAKRSRHPNPTVFTDNQTDLQLAVVSTATPAKQMVERIMYSVWNERKSFAARLPPKYGYLDPADPVTLTLNDGHQVRGRLGKADVGVDHSIDTTIIVETTQQTVSVATADDGIPWVGSDSIADPSPSKLILIDSPLLRDGDDMGGAAMRGYWAAGSYRTAGGWPGAVLQASHDAASWLSIATASDEMTWGAIEAPPADPASFWRTQFDGTMTIVVSGGTYVPTATNDLGLADLQNPMAIIKGNGEVEVIQYRDVIALGSNRYTLSVFYRGVRGTDAMGGGIRSGDIFVFLSTIGVNELPIPIAEHNVLDFYRGVTSGSLSATGLVTGFKFHGRDLMPYAPDNARAALSGSDVVLTWVRRTRFAGEMRDGIDTVPLNEATEAYEVDILSGPGGSVLRTLNSVTSTVTYSAGQIATDFGTLPASLSVDIYQMSAVVGRGFATEELLEVA